MNGKIIHPGDPGWNPDKRYPWDWIAKLAGIQPQKGVNCPIVGYFIVDRRQTPWTLIFKNFSMLNPITTDKPVFTKEPPVLFSYAGECVVIIKSMHLSADDEQLLAVAALSPDPGMGQPKPTHAFFDPKEYRQR